MAVAGQVPPVQARGKALAVLAEALGLPFPRPLASPVARVDEELDGVTGYLYVPVRPSPPVLLLPGAAPLGKDDPRAVRLARALARAGRTVFVPDLVLSEQRFVEDDLDRIVRAALALEGHPSARGRVQVLGISFGGSLALVAAADPRLRGRLEQVAVFGAYWDLVGVIQAVTTGVSLVGGERLSWEPHPMAAGIVREQGILLAPRGTRADLRAALNGSGGPGELDPAARAVYDLLTNTDPDRTYELAARLVPEARGLLRRFSPSSVAARIEAPVVAMHSLDDPTVPFGEALRLVRGLPGARLVTVRLFRHVDFRDPGDWLAASGDLWRAWRFATWVVGVQE